MDFSFDTEFMSKRKYLYVKVLGPEEAQLRKIENQKKFNVQNIDEDFMLFNQVID